MSERVIAVDPGTRRSGIITLVDGRPDGVVRAKMDNHDVLVVLAEQEAGLLAIESTPGYGSSPAQGLDLVKTDLWAGRFIGAWDGPYRLFSRTRIKSCLCGRVVGVGDSDVRTALCDLFGGKEMAIGGRRCSACNGRGWAGRERLTCPVGTKAPDKTGEERCWDLPPGPLAGIAADVWSALAVGVVAIRWPEVGWTLEDKD